ncbi:hypothetical protein HYDPIDRAFT_166709 [Hydnomerulius pinastri MD-312]|nr:hypothetical protein HYDPIDRAFT_166709 [Hydnomerulius pinastri MD-312]
MWLGQRSFRVVYTVLPLLCHEVAANTEIINFLSSQEHTVDLPSDVVGNWPKLNFPDNQQQWALQPAALHTPLHRMCETDEGISSSGYPLPCPHELWVTLDLDDKNWVSYSAFTLRLSWAASTPADFLIEVYSPEAALARLSQRQQISSGSKSTNTKSSHSSQGRPTTRSKYARIRVVDAGVRTPWAQSQSDSVSDAPANLAVELAPVPFILILEQLHMGVIPASLLPTIYFLIPVLLMAAMAVPWVIAYLDTFVRQAREDLKRQAALGKKER